jgi:hypothetical protein
MFVLKIKEKSGLPFLPVNAFPASFNEICSRLRIMG